MFRLRHQVDSLGFYKKLTTHLALGQNLINAMKALYEAYISQQNTPNVQTHILPHPTVQRTVGHPEPLPANLLDNEVIASVPPIPPPIMWDGNPPPLPPRVLILKNVF